MGSMDMPRWSGENPQGLGAGEVVFSREEHTKCLPSAKWSSSENIHTSNIWTDQVIFRNIYVNNIYIYACSNNERRGREFEGKWGRFGEEERGETYYLKNQKSKRKEEIRKKQTKFRSRTL